MTVTTSREADGRASSESSDEDGSGTDGVGSLADWVGAAVSLGNTPPPLADRVGVAVSPGNTPPPLADRVAVAVTLGNATPPLPPHPATRSSSTIPSTPPARWARPTFREGPRAAVRTHSRERARSGPPSAMTCSVLQEAQPRGVGTRALTIDVGLATSWRSRRSSATTSRSIATGDMSSSMATGRR